MRAQTASLVGIPSKTTWSTTASVKLEGGEIYLAASFSGSEQAPHDGRRFVKLLESLIRPDSRELYLAMENFLPGLAPDTIPSLALILKHGDQTALFAYGFGLLGLVRGQSGRWLADGSQEKVVLEGEVRPGDLFFLATARVLDLNLKLEALVGRPADDVSLLFSRLQSHPQSGELAILTLQIRDEKDDVVNESEPVLPLVADAPGKSRLIGRPAGSRHLIDPEKIEQGILASEEEKTRRLKRGVDRSQLWHGLRQGLRSRKTLVRAGIGVAVVVLLVLAMVVYRGAALNKERLSVVVPLEQMVAEALALPPEKIGEQRSAIQSLLERLSATRVTYGANRRRVRELLAMVEEKNAAISGEKELVNLPVFYDFRLVNSEFLAAKAAREKNRSVFLDSGSGTILALNLDTKQNETYPREGISGALDITLAETAAYVLQPGQVMKSVVTAAKAEEAGSLAGVSEPFLLDRFGGTLYILDRPGQQIWRLSTEPDATPSGWIKSARGVDFSTITSLAINGSIWLGTSDGNIFEFVRGERQSFSVSGLVDPFTTSLYLAVTEEGERLAVVEPAKKRLVVVNKQGEYQLQVESEQIGAVTDVFLSEDERSVYLVAGSVVYKVDL